MTYADIWGWFDFDDVYQNAVADARPGGILVEVGCWMGKSIVYLAKAAADAGRTDLQIWAVDNWSGSGCDRLDEACREFERSGFPLLKQFCANLTACGVENMVHILVDRDDAGNDKFLNSVEAADRFLDGACDFVFLDADHTHEAVRADIRAWLPKVRPGGVLAGHDFDRHSVASAVASELGTVGVIAAKTSWVYKKDNPDGR